MSSHTSFFKRIVHSWPYAPVLLPVLTELFQDGRLPADWRSVTTAATLSTMTFLLIFALMRSKRKLEQMSAVDKLTELNNSHSLRVELGRLVGFAHRTCTPLSVIFMDLDNFKRVNDTHGHLTGSRLLHHFAQVLLATVRTDVDLCFRFGGDEFVVLSPETPLTMAHAVGKRILQVVALDNELFGKKVTVSIGVAQLESQETATELIQRADNAMYRAKSDGKNGVAISRPHLEVADSPRSASIGPVSLRTSMVSPRSATQACVREKGGANGSGAGATATIF